MPRLVVDVVFPSELDLLFLLYTNLVIFELN